MKIPLIVVITINYNQSRMTLECINSILKSSYQNFKLMIIDNGSKKEDSDFLRNSITNEVEFVKIAKNCGYVGGVNLGFEKAIKFNPDFFLIMNNDTIIHYDAIKYLVQTGIKFNSKAIVSGKTYFYDRPDVIQYTGSYFYDRNYLKEKYPGKNEKDTGQCNEEAERDMLDDVFWLIPLEIHNKVGNYSNYFFLYGEQADFALRCIKFGYKLIYSPDAKIWHKGSLTTGDGDGSSPVVNFWRHKSSIIFLYRNLRKDYFLKRLLRTISKQLIKNMLNLLMIRKATNKKSDFAALIGSFYGVAWIFNKQSDNGYNPFIK